MHRSGLDLGALATDAWPIDSSTKTRNIVIISLVGSFLFAAAIGGFLWWYEGNEEDAARTASDQLAAAVMDNDPSAAPDGASDYVAGMREYFGPVKEARTVDVRQVDNYGQTTNTADDRSWWTSTIFLRSERGAALVLVTFADSLDPKDAKVAAIRELSPRKLAKGALTDAESRDARRGFASRGGKTATDLTLADAFPQQRGRPRAAGGQRRLKCVQRARGHVGKLQRCAKL